MDDKKITVKSRSIFGCREMKKSFSELALEELFASENHDKDNICGGSHQAFVPSDIGDDMHFSFKNVELLNGFSGTAYPEEKAYWSQNPDPNDSGLPVMVDSQSLICVDSPALGKNHIGQEKASGGGSSGSSDEGSSNPIDPKRAKRMILNRQSAQRSRKRKQAELAELEQQVEHLQGENSSLFKQLTDASHQFKEASTNHRVLKSDVEALRAKVKLAEDMLARGSMTSGLSHLIQNYLNTAPDYMNNDINCVGILSRPVPGGDISESTYSTGMTDSANTGLGNGSCVSDGGAANTLPPLPDLWAWGSNAAPVSKGLGNNVSR